MNKGLLIGLGLVAVLILGVPMLSALKEEADPAPEGAPASGETASSPAAPAPAPDAGVYTPTAADFTNTAWSIPTPAGQATIHLQAGGTATAQVPGMGNVQGSWSVSGNTLTAKAMGRTLACQIQGNQLYYNGQPVQRVR